MTIFFHHPEEESPTKTMMILPQTSKGKITTKTKEKEKSQQEECAKEIRVILTYKDTPKPM